MRKGQVWSSDFALSILIFSIASVIAFTLIINTIDDRAYEDTRVQAAAAADLLMGEGYPVHWANGTVVRAGIASDDRVSLRKIRELSMLSGQRFRSSVRTTDHTYVYFTNASNATFPLFGTCGVGNASVASVAQNRTLPALHLGSNMTFAQVLNMTAQVNDAVYENITSYDVIFIEGAFPSNLTQREIARIMDRISQRGVTVIIVGNPGMPLVGLQVNASNATQITVVQPRPELSLSAGDTIAVSGIIPTINVPNGTDVSNTRVIATTDQGMVAVAAWTYNDAQVWYFATANGLLNGANFTLTVGNATRRMVEVSWPQCSSPSFTGAEQIATYTRTIAYHEDLLQMHVVVWRE